MQTMIAVLLMLTLSLLKVNAQPVAANDLTINVAVFLNLSQPFSNQRQHALEIALSDINLSTLITNVRLNITDATSLQQHDIYNILSASTSYYILLDDSPLLSTWFCLSLSSLTQTLSFSPLPVLSLAPSLSVSPSLLSQCPSMIQFKQDSLTAVDAAVDIVHKYTLSSSSSSSSSSSTSPSPSLTVLTGDGTQDTWSLPTMINRFNKRAQFRGTTINKVVSCSLPSLGVCMSNLTSSVATQFIFAFLPASYANQFIASAVQNGLLASAQSNVLFFLGPDLTSAIINGPTNSAVDGILGFDFGLDVHHKDYSIYTKYVAAVQGTPLASTVNSSLAMRALYDMYDALFTISKAASQLSTLAQSSSLSSITPAVVAFPLYNSTVSISFLGATGPVKFFSPSRVTSTFVAGVSRRLIRLSLLQIRAPSPSSSSSSYSSSSVGLFSPMTGFTVNSWSSFAAVNAAQNAAFLMPNLQSAATTPFVANNWVWSPIPWSNTPPTTRLGHCQVISENSDLMYVFGGTDSPANLPKADTWTYNFIEESWTLIPTSSIVTPRSFFYGGCGVAVEANSTSLTERLYTFGGIGSDGIVGSMWKFTLSTRAWSSFPLPDTLITLGVLDRAEYGYHTSSSDFVIYAGVHAASSVEEIFMFSMPTETWRVFYPTIVAYSWLQNSTTTFAGGPRALNVLGNFHPILARASVGPLSQDTLFVIGGRWAIPNVVQVYDFASNKMGPFFTFGASIPFDLQLTVNGIVFANKIYITHGWSETSVVNYNTLYTLDINCPSSTCGQYVQLPNWQTDTRDSFRPMLLGTDLLIFGGWGGAAIHNDFMKMSLITGDRTPISPDSFSPSPRQFAATCNLGNVMYMFGGQASSSSSLGSGSSFVALNDLWGFVHDTGVWSLVSSTNLAPAARWGHTLSNLRAALYLFGGTNGVILFSDLNVFSPFTKMWTSVPATVATLSNTYKTLIPRAYHVTATLSESIAVMYGGIDEAGSLLQDLWYYNRINQEWVLYADTAIAPVYQSAGVAVSNVLYVFGGWDIGQNSVPFAFACDFGAVVANTYNAGLPSAPAANPWRVLASMPGKGRSALTAAAVDGGDMVAVFGGSYYEIELSELLLYSISLNSWTTVPSSLTASVKTPISASGLVSVVYGNKFVWFGGSFSSVSNVRSATYLSNQVWSFTLGPPCSNSSTPFNASTAQGLAQQCSPCGAGTYLQGNTCVSCPPGTFASRTVGATSCTPCAAGNYNQLSGAVSESYCIPCAFGTYAPTPGTVTCSVCDAALFFCPVGSSLGIPLNGVNSSLLFGSGLTPYSQRQPSPLTPKTALVAQMVTLLSIILGALLGALFVLYVVMHHVVADRLGFAETVRNALKKVDLLFDLSHFNNIDGPLFRRQTPLGGVFTFFCMILITYFVFTLAYPYAIDNSVEVRSLVPNTAVSDYSSITAEVLFSATVGTSYVGQCIVPDRPIYYSNGVTDSVTANTTYFTNQKALAQSLFNRLEITGTLYVCNPGITLATTSYTNAASAYLCQLIVSKDGTRSCKVYYGCSQCKPSTVSSNVRFLFYETNTFASIISWSMTSTSGYTGQPSSLNGSVTPLSTSNLFRGGGGVSSTSTVISVDLTPARNTDTLLNSTSYGNHLFFAGAQGGSETPPTQFNLNDGLEVWFNLQLLITTLDVVVSPKVTPQQFVASLLGSISGAIAGIAILMAVTEIIEEIIVVKLRGKGADKSHESERDDRRFKGTMEAYNELVTQLVSTDPNARLRSRGRVHSLDFMLGKEEREEMGLKLASVPTTSPRQANINSNPNPHAQTDSNANANGNGIETNDVELATVHPDNQESNRLSELGV